MSRPRSPATLATMARVSSCQSAVVSSQSPPLTFPRPPALINQYWRVVAAERRAMLRAWGAWLDQRPNLEHVEQELEATVSAMRQMVALREETP